MAQAGTTGMVVFAIVGCVVLLGTVNLAQLLLARALGRASEVALRLSLGARRVVVARQLLVENLLLGFFGLAAGVALAAAIAAILPRLMVSQPAMLAAIGSSTTSFQLDWRVFSFATALAFVTMLLLALVPLSQVAKPELLPVLQSASATRTETKPSFVRRSAIWLQIGSLLRVACIYRSPRPQFHQYRAAVYRSHAKPGSPGMDAGARCTDA